jgi:hypothetical protein
MVEFLDHDLLDGSPGINRQGEDVREDLRFRKTRFFFAAVRGGPASLDQMQGVLAIENREIAAETKPVGV